VSIQDFDNLTAALANRAISRRRALQMAAASALGAVGLGLAAGEAQAAPMCPRRGAACERACSNDRGKDCRCIRTTAGNRRCVYPCCEPNDTQVRGCNVVGDCRDTEFCMRTTCCDTPAGFEGVCVRRCDASRDFTCGDQAVSAQSSGGAWS